MTHPKAIQACQFFESLTLIGDFSGQPWKLEPYQRDWISELYGTRNEDGTRKISKVSLWMPRGGGKTQQAAGNAAYELICGPPGREVYAAAPDKDKAGRIYKAMSEMIRVNPYLDAMCDCSDHFMRIKVKSRNSIFQALAADEDQGHSLAPSTLILDELHLWKSRKLYDALVSGGLKRKQGNFLEVQISTAGDTKSGLAWELYSYAKEVRDGKKSNPNMLVRIFETPEDSDWTSEAVWRQAMPYEYVNFKTIATECEQAKEFKYKEFSFRQLYLGHWLEHSEAKWLDPDEWRGCKEEYTEADMEGQECIAALDLSCVRDLTSLSLFYPSTKRCLSWSWLPAEGIAKREEKDRVPYREWEKQGLLFLTSGNRIVHSEVGEKVNEILQRYNVTKFVADPHSLHLIAPFLTMEPETYTQSPSMLSPPATWLEVAVSERTFHHNGNPLLDWTAGNVVVEKDKFERITPHKTKSRKRIDPMVALIMAIGKWMDEKDEYDINAFFSKVENYTIPMKVEEKSTR